MFGKKEKAELRFDVVYDEINPHFGGGRFSIIRDNETGVHYLKNQDGGLSMIPLHDCEGKIVVDKPNPEYQSTHVNKSQS